MDDTLLISELKKFKERHGTQREASKALNISIAYLNDMLHGRRRITEYIAGRLGYEARWVKITTV